MLSRTRWFSIGVGVVMSTLVARLSAAPQVMPTGDPPGPTDHSEEHEDYIPYEYEYRVEDVEKDLYHGKEENGDETGRVEGKYYVWLPDKRLMTVSYYVDGDSGFMPTITIEKNANPYDDKLSR